MAYHKESAVNGVTNQLRQRRDDGGVSCTARLSSADTAFGAVRNRVEHHWRGNAEWKCEPYIPEEVVGDDGQLQGPERRSYRPVSMCGTLQTFWDGTVHGPIQWAHQKEDWKNVELVGTGQLHSYIGFTIPPCSGNNGDFSGVTRRTGR